jgi:hypothetical protein
MSTRNKKAAVISFDLDHDDSKLEFVKHQRTTTDANDVRETTEERVPKLAEDASPYEILRFLSAFNRTKINLSWTTGPKLFQKFPMHLEGYHYDAWELITDGVNPTVALFTTSIEEFKNELLEGYTYEDQMDYLRDLKKPGKLEPSTFLLKL